MSSSHPYIVQDPAVVVLSLATALTLTCRSLFTMLLGEPVEVEIEDSAVSDGPATIEKDGDTEDAKGKGKAVMVPIEDATTPPFETRLAEMEAEIGDTAWFWQEYEPPDALRNVDGVESDILLRIIPESIDTVVARLLEDKARKELAVEAAEQGTQERSPTEEEGASETNSKVEDGGNPPNAQHDGSSSPVVQPTQPKASRPEYSSPSTVDFAGTTFAVDRNGFLQLTPSANRKKQSLRERIFRRHNTNSSSKMRVESSAAAAARNEVPSISWSKLKKAASNGSNPDSTSTSEKQIECVSCLDEFTAKELVKGPCHSYCHDCFRRLITTACQNEAQWPPKCCLNAIPKKTVLGNVNSTLGKTYRKRAEEWSIPVSDRVYCSHTACSLWLRPRQVDRSAGVAKCTRGHRTCTVCRGPDHQGGTCPRDVDMLRTEELAEEEGWRRCHGCRAYVEHRDACQHMTCRCGAEFCYVCGARWPSCACTMEQLAAVKQGAEARRRSRRARQEAEEAEAAEAVRLVAEFEREEARKAELLRQEQEERERRALEQHIEKELARRLGVELAFQGLRGTLAAVHQRQMDAVNAALDEERRTLEADVAAALGAMAERHGALRESLAASTEAVVLEHRASLDRECVARARAELRLESEYLGKLVEYYQGKADGEQKIAAAMDDLGRNMDARFRTWQKWMHNELETFAFRAREEQTVRLELLEHAERQLAEQTADTRAALERRVLAQLKWLAVVVSERNSALAEAETDELINNHDFDALFPENNLDLELGVPDA